MVDSGVWIERQQMRSRRRGASAILQRSSESQESLSFESGHAIWQMTMVRNRSSVAMKKKKKMAMMMMIRAFLQLELLLLLAAAVHAGDIGFCYGRFADNLPTPQKVAQFLVNKSIRKIRIFDNDQTVIQAFANTNIELIIGITNGDLPNLQTEQQADTWVTSYLAPLVSATNISVISVGSEVITNDPSDAPLLLPAMKNLHTGLTKANLAGQIKVTTANSMAILQNSFPPSAAGFNQSFATSFMKPLLDYLESIGSILMINAYPYLAYTADPATVPLDYALFEAKSPVTDPNTNLQYYSLFDAQLDALYFAMEGSGYPKLTVVVSETGWPTKGDANEPGATVQNAETYNNNLVARVVKNIGTPHRPNQPVDAYIFSLFNEDTKPGAESERNWGVFNVDETNIYPLDLTATNTSSPAPAPQAVNSTTGTTGTTGTWCVAKPGASNNSLSDGINWACGQGNADCGPIQSGQACYQPDTFENHASYAYNSYYQKSGDTAAACNFNGTAMITTTDPSYGSCKFSTDGTAQSPHSSTSGNASSAAVHVLLHWEFRIIPTLLLFSLV